MCGIAGFVDTSRRCGSQELRDTVLEMANTLRHRGPNDVGAWVDAEVGIALGHRRLSILDLSPKGHQPMRSSCGRYVISYNGEVYNFQDLRCELEGCGHSFRGHSDTEVMLSCISQWGIHEAVKRFNGMFAFALWDRQERLLHLVRDRMGEKPLYYGWIGKVFVFGSELKALRAHPDFDREVDRQALTLYMRWSRIPAPYSIYNGISKVLPGAIVTVAPTDVSCSPKVTPYWTLRAAVERGLAEPFTGSEAEAITCLEELLKDAVKLQMEADVPLGAFLSGGIDSSIIVALMQAQSVRPVQTFTIGFKEGAYNEAEHAKAVARHLGTTHMELYVTPEEARAVIPRLPELYDEPFGDSTQIPNFLVSELARKAVTVALSGDGGDELFGGYRHYFTGPVIFNQINWVPKVARAPLARGLRMLSANSWNTLFRTMEPFVPKRLHYRNMGENLRKVADVFTEGGTEAESLCILSGSHWTDATSCVIGGSTPLRILTDPSHGIDQLTLQESMMYSDMMTYLPDTILAKVDRASMGVSLETRVPLLDYRVVEFAWRIPLSMKIRNGKGKWLLRQLLDKYVPAALTDRPKMGFGVPMDTWLRGPLMEWAEDLLNEKKMLDQGFLNPDPFREKWAEHLSGRYDWSFHLWDVLMFQAWLEHER